MNAGAFTPEVLAGIKSLKPTPGPWFIGETFTDQGRTVFPVMVQATLDFGKRKVRQVGGEWLIAWLFQGSIPANKANAEFIAEASRPLTGYQALALEVERLMEREKPIRPVIKKRVLKAGYGYCTCSTENGAPFIVSLNQKYCPNCGKRLEWK